MAAQLKLSYVFIHELNEREYLELYEIVRDSETMKWLSNGIPWTPELLLERRNYSAQDYSIPWNARKYFYWAILSDGHVIGLIGLHPATAPLRGLQILVAVRADQRGHGVARCATRDMMQRKEVRADRRAIWAIVRVDNIPSLRAIAASGEFSETHNARSLIPGLVVFARKI